MHEWYQRLQVQMSALVSLVAALLQGLSGYLATVLSGLIMAATLLVMVNVALHWLLVRPRKSATGSTA